MRSSDLCPTLYQIGCGATGGDAVPRLRPEFARRVLSSRGSKTRFPFSPTSPEGTTYLRQIKCRHGYRHSKV